MKWDHASGALEIFAAGNKAWESYPPPAGFERNTMFIEEMKHFIAVARKKEEPICKLEDGKWALQLALAARESAEKSVPVKLTQEHLWIRPSRS